MFGRKHRGQNAKPQRRARLEVMELEDRITPATIVVTGDQDTVQVDGKVTLREAIDSANGNANINADVVAVGAYGNDTINFDIPGGGVKNITLTNQLDITDPLTINGYTQNVAAPATPNSLPVGSNAVLKVLVSGNNAVATGFSIETGNTTIKGLEVTGFTKEGIYVEGGVNRPNVKIQGNLIDLNQQNGIYLEDATGVTIGGLNPEDRNTICSNGFNGVYIAGGGGNFIQNNYIGTDPTGINDLGNTRNGIRLYNTSTNTIGGPVSAARNLISGNDFNGISIEASTSLNNKIQYNFIGTKANGTDPLGNTQEGVKIDGARQTSIGTGDPDATKVPFNVISGNGLHGVLITGAAATQNRVEGNRIGTKADGLAALANTSGGVKVDGSHGNFIGVALNGGNQISGNGAAGIEIANANNTQIERNIIGLDSDKAKAVANAAEGILINGGNNTVIGGGTAETGNNISGNKGKAIQNNGNGTNIRLGNKIGINETGAAAPNEQGGIFVAGSNTLIEGTAIWFNTGPGIAVTSGTGNKFRFNSIKSNSGIGIDLGNNGVTLNDMGDPDTGPNNLQNYPVLTSAVVSGSTTTVTGSLNSTASTTFTLEFFGNQVASAPLAEGEWFLGSYTVTTNSSGNANFTAVLPAAYGNYVTATATDPSDNTSEFSTAVAVSAGLQAVSTPDHEGSESPSLTAEALGAIWSEAVARWKAAGVDVTALNSVTVSITDLPDLYLGMAAGNTIWLDVNAAGWGWYVDPTPWNDSEFRTPGDQGEQDHMDLLSAVMHEMGHVLGFDHDDGVMSATLAPGTRYTPAASQGAFPMAASLNHYFAELGDKDAIALARETTHET